MNARCCCSTTRRAINRLKFWNDSAAAKRIFAGSSSRLNELHLDEYGDDATYALMTKLGDEVGECVRGDQFAPNADPQFDPEGLYDFQLEHRKEKDTSRARCSKLPGKWFG